MNRPRLPAVLFFRNLMTIRLVFVLVVFALLSGFVALNWTEFIAPTTLSLGFSTTQAPLGLVLLGVLVLVVGLFAVYVLYLHSADLLRTRRLLKEMETQKKLLEQAEASRFTELRSFVAEQFALQGQRHAETLAAVRVQSPLDKQSDRTWLEEVHNGLSAQLGQLEDRLDRLLPQSQSIQP
jgi:uncharacterized integral membrane protein